MEKNILVMLFLFFCSTAYGEAIFQDPSGKEFNHAYDSFSEKSLKSMAPPERNKEKYLLALLYINGDKEFDVKKDCNKGMSLLQDLWKDRVLDAGYALSTFYYSGDCVNKNITMSRQLAQKTAEDGYILSQKMLGYAYLGKKWEGLYATDVKKAILWLGKAGDAGDRESAGILAYMYREGENIEVNEKKSFYWIKKAVFTKFDPSSNIGFTSLASYYEKGFGTQKDLIQAYKYYDLSGSAGAEGKQRITKDMTQEQIDEAIRESKAWQKENNVEIGGGFIQRAN